MGFVERACCYSRLMRTAGVSNSRIRLLSSRGIKESGPKGPTRPLVATGGRIISFSNVASASNFDSMVTTGGTDISLNYTTSTNNIYVVGVASNQSIATQQISVTGNADQYFYQLLNVNYNTTHAHGNVPSSGSHTDIYSGASGALTSAITVAFNAM